MFWICYTAFCQEPKQKNNPGGDAMGILLVVYVVIGYWAVEQTFLGKPIPLLTEDYRTHKAQKVLCALFLGWLVIPIVIVQRIMRYIKKSGR